MNGAELILKERERQVTEEGWSHEHDEQYVNDELILAAICYADPQNTSNDLPDKWPWEERYWRPKDRIRNLVRAGALIAAEIDRLHR